MPAIVHAETLSSNEPVASNGQLEGDFAKPDEFVRLPISDDLNPLAPNVCSGRDPHTLAIAIASFGIASIGIGFCIVPSALKTYM